MNQCDGCKAGLPVDKNGNHCMGKPGGYPNLMGCQKDRYVDEYEKKKHEAMAKEYEEAQKDMRQKLADLGVLDLSIMAEWAAGARGSTPTLVIPMSWVEDFLSGLMTYGELSFRLQMARAALLDLPLGEDQTFYTTAPHVE